jgi:hypothetical protein
MVTFMIGTLCGAALGLQFKVYVLFPAIAVGIGLAAGVAASQGGDLRSVFFAIVLTAIGLQVGYFGGATARHFIAVPVGSDTRGGARAAAVSALSEEKAPNLYRFPTA